MGHYILFVGALFVTIAALGIWRLPELFARMHASTKAGTLGLGLIMCALAWHFQDVSIGLKALATMLFVALTAPVTAHVVGRAAYYTGVPLWKDTVIDEMEIM